MSSYPEKSCEIERLVTQKPLVEAALAGRKTQQRRDGVYAYPNEEFVLEGVNFRVTDLYQERLGDLTDETAQAEGFPSLEAYKGIILRMHANMEWNEEALVWVHCFEKV